MQRPNMLVVWKNPETGSEVGFSSGQVIVNFDGTVTIMCSGNPTIVKGKDILRIEYAVEGATYCQTCDQNISHFIQC